jgi:hypothetical protein
MRHYKKRWLAFLLTLCMVLTMCPLSVVTASADDTVTFTALRGTEGVFGQSYENLIDGDISTKWCVEDFFMTGAEIVFEASQPICVNGYTITTAYDSDSWSGRNPSSWTLSGSNDDITWNVIDTKTNDYTMQDINYTSYDFTCSSSELYTYFKLEITATQGGNYVLQMSEFALKYSTEVSDSEVADTAVTFEAISGTSGATSEEGYEKLIDGSKYTKWCVENFAANSAEIVFKASQAICVNGYTITTANDNNQNPGRNPKTWTLYGSNDNSTWTVIDTKIDDMTMDDVNYTSYDFTCSNSKSYSYFKLEITATQADNVLQMSEFALKYSTDVSDLEETDTTVTFEAVSGTGGANDSESCEYLLDGFTTTKWCVIGFTGAEIVFKASQAIRVKGYTITTANDNNEYPGRNPKTWTLYGSNDNGLSWTAIDKHINDYTMKDVNYTPYNFTCNSSELYSYFKLEITEVQENDALQMSELTLDYSTTQPCSDNEHTDANNDYYCDICGTSFITVSGNYGETKDNVKWFITKDNVLVISGTGKMYEEGVSIPWSGYSSVISKIIIDDSVASIDITDLTNLKVLSATGDSGTVVVYVPENMNVDMTGNIIKKIVVSDGVKLVVYNRDDYKFAIVVNTLKFGGSRANGALYLDEVDVIDNETRETNVTNYIEVDDDNIEFRVNYTENPKKNTTVRGQVEVKKWANEDAAIPEDSMIYYVTKAYNVYTDGYIIDSEVK